MNGSQSSSMITAEKAKELALRHTGLPVSSVTFIKAELDDDDGVAVYDVEFYSGNMEYDYEVHAVSGDVLDYDCKMDDETF